MSAVVSEAAKALELVDAALPAVALVVGSLPPCGRDLDLLVHEPEQRVAEATLRDAGFEEHGGSWVRFAGSTAAVIELLPAAGWGLPEAELGALFADAVPLGGCARLCRPAPHHALLVLARKVTSEGLDSRHRGRVDAAVAEDPDAWRRALERAPAWRAEAGLATLEAGDAGRRRRVRECLAPALRARLAGARALRAGRRRGTVIALSGLDGAGKSTQAASLAETLGRLGYDAEVAWTRIASNDAFWRVAFAVKRRLASLRRGPANPPDALPMMQQRSGRATTVWAAVVALDNVRAQRKVTGAALARDHVVICDRYTLDSIVELRVAYGDSRRLAAHRMLLRHLTRKPLRAFLLDIPPEVARERDDEHDLDVLRARHALYREEHGALAVARLDGCCGVDDLAAEIAREVWRALRMAR